MGEDKSIVFRSRKMEKFCSQPFKVAEVFTGIPGSFVPLTDTIQGFRDIMDGNYDETPELAFYMIGGTDEIEAKAEKLQAEKERLAKIAADREEREAAKAEKRAAVKG